MWLSRNGGGAGSCLLLQVVVMILWITTPSLSQITFTDPPNDLVVALGSSARFDCAFTTASSVSVSWEKDGVFITPVERFSYLVNNSLLISSTAAGDNGTYTCVVTDQASLQRVERGATLTFALILNTFVSTPEDQTVDQGVTFLLFCTHGGSLPPATISWTHNNDIIVTSSRIFVQQSTLGHTNPPQVSSSIVVTSVVPGDAGLYACVANNPLLSTSVTSSPATIIVRDLPSPPSITRQPDDVIAIPGQSTNFSCSFGGEPPPTVTWSLDNVPLTTSNQISVVTTGGSSLLTIAAAQMSDSGEYRCLATNSQGSATSEPALLQIADISVTFELQPQDTVLALGRDGVLNCQSPSSLPPAQISWTRNSTLLSDMRYRILENGSLMISSAQLEDQGMYRCVATNALLGVSRTSQSAAVTVIVEPTIVPQTVTVDLGQSVTLLCSVRGSSAPTLSWFKGETQLLDSDPRLSVSGGTLVISSIVLNDRGFYTCRADFASGRTESQAYISVRAPPEFVNTSIVMAAIVDTPTTLPCDIIMDPTITFTWQFDGMNLDPTSSGGVYTILADGSLMISNVNDTHEGTFTCVATNSLGTASGNVFLFVHTPPTVTADSASVLATEGNTAILRCTSTGDPVPSQTWSRNGTQLMSSGRYQISDGGSVLTVQQVSEDLDEGVFTCHASNAAGSDSATITLSVQVLPVVTATPISQQIDAGESVLFDCAVSGDPTPQMRWLNTDSVDVTSLNDSRIRVLSNGSLIITDLRSSDQQLYFCEGANAVGTTTVPVSLFVIVAPSVSLSEATTAVQGNSLTLDCNPIGQPVPDVVWFRNNVELTLTARITIDRRDRLVFSSVLSADEGEYRCVATSTAGTASASTTLTVLVAPSIQPQQTPVIANETSQAVLDCVVTGNPSPTVSWFFNSSPLPDPSVPRIQQASNGSLIFSPVQKGDEGSYVCRASNSAGMESETFQLRVYIAAAVSALEPSITVIEGTTASLTCVATGDPVPSQTWSRNGNQLTSSGRYQISDDGSVLTVQQVSEAQDEGVFTCHASNAAGSDSATITLSVQVPPRFNPPPVNSTAVEGAQHVLTCAASGDPAPQIRWSSSEGVVSMQATLSFSAVARGNSGFYTCVASNSAGSVSSEVYLDVHYSPSILQPPLSVSVAINSTAVFVCVTDGNPPPQITWLYNSVPIPEATEPSYTISMVTASSGGQYTCSASNIIGTVSRSASLTVLFPPSPPTLLSASTLSSSAISVQWSASSSDGGSPITSYVVEYRDNFLASAPFQTTRVGSDVTSFQITGLMAFITYDVRIRAENGVGLSDPSNTISVRTHQAAPSAPRNFRVTSSDSTSLSLAWDVPDPINGQLAVYELRYTNELSSAVNSRLLFGVTQSVISGLVVGVTYRVQVRASTVGLQGDSLWGPYSTLRVRNGVVIEVPTDAPPTTAAPTTPPPPTTEEATTLRPTTQPTTIQVGVATTEVVMTTEDAEEEIETTLPPTTMPEETTTAIVTTVAVVLNPPTVAPSQVFLFIPAGTVGQVEVVWREPTSGLDTFIGYQIIISPAPPSPLTTPILRPSTPGTSLYSFPIIGLANFTVYTITVATYNDDGVGPLTAQETIRTPEAAPGSPQNVQTLVLSSGTAVSVSWLPPIPTNGIILQYSVRIIVALTGQVVDSQTVAVGSSDSEQQRGQSVIFTGLDFDNVRYRIEVYASTSVGQGPSSSPLFVGMDTGTVTFTMESTQETTSSVELPTMSQTDASGITSSVLLPTTPITDAPGTPSSDPTTMSGLSMTTDTPPIIGETDAAPLRDDEYYIVRIVPPVVVVLFIVVIVVAVAMGFCCHSRVNRESKKGLYTFDASQDYMLKSKRALDGDRGVAIDDDVETSSYHVKDALDANFTYNYSNQPLANSHGRGQMGNGRQPMPPHQPSFGQAHTTSGWYPSAGRDAVQESDSRPDSGEMDIMPAQVRDSGNTLESQFQGSLASGQRLPYPPGDYTHAEVEVIRAKKAQERAKNYPQPGQSAPPQMTFDPNLGFSNGGIMETRIGAVGGKGLDQIPPEASAHMY